MGERVKGSPPMVNVNGAVSALAKSGVLLDIINTYRSELKKKVKLLPFTSYLFLGEP